VALEMGAAASASSTIASRRPIFRGGSRSGGRRGRRVVDDRAPLVGVARRAEALAVAGRGGLVLEQLADLGEAEPGVVAEALDEPEALEVVLVVEAVRPSERAAGFSSPSSS
jgi:hypothetical protein